MLNLQLLEQKLDKALAEETNESLTKWISNNRIKERAKKVPFWIKFKVDLTIKWVKIKQLCKSFS